MSDKNFNDNFHPNLQAVHDSMLDGLGQLSDYFGFSKVMGQLYAALLLSPEPLSLDDLMARLDISKASVSMNIRTLEHMGMVRQVWLRGKSGRRKYYEAETDFLQIMTNILSGREMRDVDRALSIMQDNAKLLEISRVEMEGDEELVADLYLKRLKQISGVFKFAQLVIMTILEQASQVNLDDFTKDDDE